MQVPGAHERHAEDIGLGAKSDCPVPTQGDIYQRAASPSPTFTAERRDTMHNPNEGTRFTRGLLNALLLAGIFWTTLALLILTPHLLYVWSHT